MAYTALSTKADGDILTATHLNAVAGNIEFLYGVVQGTNAPFHSHYATLSSDDAYYALIHRHDYLLYSIVAVGATGGGETAANLTLTYSTDGSSYSSLTGGSITCSQGTHTGAIDVSGRTLDTPYYIKADVTMNDSTSVHLLYLFESDSDTI